MREMRRVPKAMARLVAVLLVGVATSSPLFSFPQEPTGPPKVQTVKPPAGVVPERIQAKVGELVQLKADQATARWETVPSTEAGSVRDDGRGGSFFSATEAGVYYLVCYSAGGATWVEVTVGTPEPRPRPNPGPNPGPTPVPTGTVKRFVVVEDTRKAGQFRGDVMSSSTVQTYYKANGLKHRIVDVAAPEGADAEATAFIARAAGKALPWLYLFDEKGVEIGERACPIKPDEFVLALQSTSPAPPSRRMGNKVPTVKLKAGWKEFGSEPKVPLIPRNEWKPVDLSAFLPDVKDQDGVGACNAFATVTAVEACRQQQGLPYRRLSPGYLYGNINGQRDDGSLLEDGLEWMTSKGTCLASTVPELAWKRSQWPAKAATEASDFVVLEAYVCPGFDAMASALQQGFFIVEGLAWYDNFTPDADGWLPARGRGNWGGHALAGYGLVKRGSTWGIATRNSWGETWGKKGDCVIPEPLFDNKIGGFWAVRSVKQVDGAVGMARPSDPLRSARSDATFALAW